MFIFISSADAFATEPRSVKDILGEKHENKYSNDCLDIEAVFPDDWMILQDEEIEHYRIGYANSTDIAALEERLEQGGSFLDLYAVQPDHDCTVMVMFQNLEASFNELTQEDEKTIALVYIMGLKSKLENSGLGESEADVFTCKSLGVEHPALKVKINRNGEVFYERTVLIKAGRYLATITVSSKEEKNSDELLNLFGAIHRETNGEYTGDVLGTKEGNQYINQKLGLKAEFPADWRILSAEEAMELVAGGMEKTGHQALVDILEQYMSVYDLYAISSNRVDNLSIQIQIGTKSEITEEALLLAEKETIERDLIETGMGELMEELQISVEKCSFAGEEHECLDVSMKVTGIPIYERVLVFERENYIVKITSFSADEESATSILNIFEAI